MAPHSSTLAWKIPWTEEPGALQTMGLLRIGHDWVSSLSLFTFMHWRRKWQPTPVFLPGESQGQGAWWAAIYGVTQSQTQLKRLSSSSSIILSIRVITKCIHSFIFHKFSLFSVYLGILCLDLLVYKYVYVCTFEYICVYMYMIIQFYVYI